MTTSTITTVVVFLPLRLLEGVVGQFFAALSITLTIAVLVSLVLALTIIPLLGEQFLTGGRRGRIARPPPRGARAMRARCSRASAAASTPCRTATSARSPARCTTRA